MTASNHTLTYVASLIPNGTVQRCSAIACMIGVLDPLVNVAVHIVKAKGIGLLLGEWVRLVLGVPVVPRIIAELRLLTAK